MAGSKGDMFPWVAQMGRGDFLSPLFCPVDSTASTSDYKGSLHSTLRAEWSPLPCLPWKLAQSLRVNRCKSLWPETGWSLIFAPPRPVLWFNPTSSSSTWWVNRPWYQIQRQWIWVGSTRDYWQSWNRQMSCKMSKVAYGKYNQF